MTTLAPIFNTKFTAAAIASACLVYALTVTWPAQHIAARDPKSKNNNIVVSHTTLYDDGNLDLLDNHNKQSKIPETPGEVTMPKNPTNAEIMEKLKTIENTLQWKIPGGSTITLKTAIIGLVILTLPLSGAKVLSWLGLG
jgi:hypothetical protein